MGAPGPGFHPVRPRPYRPQARLAAGHVHSPGSERRDAGAREGTVTPGPPAASPQVTPAPGGSAASPPQSSASRHSDLAYHRHRNDHRRGDSQPRRSSLMSPNIWNLRELGVRPRHRAMGGVVPNPYWVSGAPRSASKFLFQIMMVRSPK